MSTILDLPEQKTSRAMPLRVRLGRRLGHSRFSFRGKDRLVRMLCHPDSASDSPFETDFFGLRYRGNLNDFIDWTVFFYGAYCNDELDLLVKYASCFRSAGQKVIYLDVGVNVGHHLLFMTRHADECYGIDAEAEVLQRAREKLEINSVANARLFNVGLRDRDEVKTFFPSTTANHAIGSFLQDRTPGATSSVGYPVQTREGSDFLAEQGIQNFNFNIVKIDVGGFEVPVLQGLADAFKQYRPFILVEMSPQAARQLGSRKALESCFYEQVCIFDVREHLKPYMFQCSTESELAVLPEEYAAISRA